MMVVLRYESFFLRCSLRFFAEENRLVELLDGSGRLLVGFWPLEVLFDGVDISEMNGQ